MLGKMIKNNAAKAVKHPRALHQAVNTTQQTKMRQTRPLSRAFLLCSLPFACARKNLNTRRMGLGLSSYLPPFFAGILQCFSRMSCGILVTLYFYPKKTAAQRCVAKKMLKKGGRLRASRISIQSSFAGVLALRPRSGKGIKLV